MTGPIAIVGMAVLMPRARTLEDYWRNLVDGVDAITDVPPNKWDAEFFDPDQAHRPDRLYCRRGGFVDELATFEPLRYGLMPASVPDIEPDQLIALDVAAAAIEDAGGFDRLPDGDRVGVILGRGGILSPAQARYAQRVRMSSQVTMALRELLPDLEPGRLDLVRQLFDERLGPHQPEGTIGLVPNLTASRIANRFNFRGAAYTLDAACASSLIAVDQAISELYRGRLDVVLAGGVHHVHDISFWSVFSQLRALSRRGEIRPFDRDADGLLIGEGTGIVVLKRMADAVRDGDRVYAVVRGIGVSSDGRSASMFNPATSGQVLAIRRAWQAAGLDPTAPDALALLEAHGTGTPTGDAAELATVAEVFGPDRGGTRPVIGSVKSMIGHTMPAAGIAGLVKAVLAVHRGVLLPTLHCDRPRPELERTRFRPLSTAAPWEGTGPRRAGVNAFGFGGINAHIIVEQPPDPPLRRGTPPARLTVEEPEQVLRLAAPDPAALRRLLDADDAEVRALAAADTTGVRARAAADPAGQRCRIGIVGPTADRLGTARRAVALGRAWRGGRDVWFSPEPLLSGPTAGQLAFVFPGLEAEFTPRVDDVAAHFGLPDRDWSVPDLGQHGVCVIEVGRLLDAALRRVGVLPDAVAGHSLGEWAAAATTGQMSTASVEEFLALFNADAVELAGYLFAYVGAGVEQVQPLLRDHPGVLISHDNAPSQCVVNGPEAQVQRLVAELRRNHVICQPLPFRSAFHTPAFANGLEAIGAALRRWDVGTPSRPVWSATIAAPYPSDPAEVSALFTRHMVEPVRFRATVAAMHDAGIRVFLQVGVGQLSSVIAENLRGRDHLAMPVNVPARSGLAQLRRVATALWVEGADPDLSALPSALAGAASGTRPTPPASGGGPAASNPPVRRGAPVRLDLGGPLVRLGPGANGLLGVTGHRTGQVSASGDTAAASGGADVLSTLERLAGGSSAAAELAALLKDTAHSAVSVLDAASRTSSYREILRVSLDDMPYLRHHCFFVQPDDWPHPEDRWPVVPATTVVQHMMDAVERAAPGVRAVAVRDARFHRWVIATPPQDVEVTVEPDGPGRYAVSFGAFARAVVEVADAYPTDPPPPLRYDPGTERPPTISAAQMYAERLMFHGPMFQGVSEVHALGDMHVRGAVTTPSPPGALLDNALQLIGNWLITTQPWRTVALPVALGRIRFFGPPPPAGKAFTCVARVRSIDDTQLVADTQLVDGDRVYAVIEGAVDRRFDSHPSARPAERFPERYPMSQRQPEGWAMAFDAWTDPVTLAMAARGILGGAAYADFERQPPATRKRWLLGRIAAKDAVRFRLWEDGHVDVYPIELTVRDEPDGRSRVDPRPGRGMPECDVSLAQCAEMAVAIARPRAGTAPPGAPGVGIDVAEIIESPERTAGFDEAESALLEAVAATGDRATWLTRARTAKEAVARAEGAGPNGTADRCTVVAATPDETTVAVSDRTYRVGHRTVANPDDLPARRYVVSWTWGPVSE
ncbi:beta-ketoacyl synthase N-terminal-like domain-containing protein [Plantactinospora sp. ZYX-F-223]|uniref:beta-ketoacyl synthase N-terminal-like domain-containing protein n=1 Tax=Plantactinospora sp. ZYX-F-223 TaxID=3144103 RepID=UPI0031FD0A53